MKPEEIARVTHEMNRLYCRGLGDYSHEHWEDAPEWQRLSAIAGVCAVLGGTAATPEQAHERWIEHKVADGWIYGAEKDPDAKTHPCLVPYAALDDSQKSKDAIFRAVVTGLADAGELRNL